MAMDLDSPAPSLNQSIPEDASPAFNMKIPNPFKTPFHENSTKRTSTASVSPVAPHDSPPVSPLRETNIPKLPKPAPIKKPPSPKKQRPNNTQPTIDLDSLGDVPPLATMPAVNGINGHWDDLAAHLPFPSKAAPSVDLSPPSTPKRNKPSFIPPSLPPVPTEVHQDSYSRYCAILIQYQTAWNEYNMKVIDHFKSRSDQAMLNCAQGKYYASGLNFIDEWTSCAKKDAYDLNKSLKQMDEDSGIRLAWEMALERHRKILLDWKTFLDKSNLERS